VKVRRVSLASVALLALAAALAVPVPAPAAPEGQITIAVHVSLAPTWFDPAETPGVITPFMTLYALHDALVKPMPGNPFTPSLAESWTVSKDGLTYDFALRKGVKFHNGDPFGAEDVKFSFERYKGGGATTLKARVAAVEVVDAHRVRFRLKQPWPDFMTFYGTPATGAAWIVPKSYIEKVGDEGFKKAPVGAGPYRFVSFNPGIELILESYDGFWRKTPAVKRLVFKSVPDESTRLAMLKRAETDVAYSIRGPNAEEVKRTPGLTLKATLPTFTEWITFTQQWDPKSPWSDRRVRLAANHAIDRKAINEAEYLGYGKPTVSIIYKTRYLITAPKTATRVCGETRPYLTGNPPNDVHPDFDIFAYVRRTGENPLLVDILTHEFLHVIWFERVINDPGDDWQDAHPDNEAWVQELLPNDCPQF